MDLDIKDLRVLVTAGANGIGLAIAKQLAASGANTYILDLERERPAEVASGFGAHGIIADCSDRAQLERAVHSLPAVPDVVMANAGLVI